VLVEMTCLRMGLWFLDELSSDGLWFWMSCLRVGLTHMRAGLPGQIDAAVVGPIRPGGVG
jgi:hypothetical protein